jgi:hypothetical protein
VLADIEALMERCAQKSFKPSIFLDGRYPVNRRATLLSWQVAR